MTSSGNKQYLCNVIASGVLAGDVGQCMRGKVIGGGEDHYPAKVLLVSRNNLLSRLLCPPKPEPDITPLAFLLNPSWHIRSTQPCLWAGIFGETLTPTLPPTPKPRELWSSLALSLFSESCSPLHTCDLRGGVIG